MNSEPTLYLTYRINLIYNIVARAFLKIYKIQIYNQLMNWVQFYKMYAIVQERKFFLPIRPIFWEANILF